MMNDRKKQKIKAIMDLSEGKTPHIITGMRFATEDREYLVKRNGKPEIITGEEYSILHGRGMIERGHIVR